MANVLQQVQTYQLSQLAFLDNLNCMIHTANKKFLNFQTYEGQLNDTVGFSLPTRFVGTDSLIATFEDVDQRIKTLTVDKEASVAYAFTNQERVFNLSREDFMTEFGEAAVRELGAKVEKDLAQKFAIDHSYRFFGDGVTPINSYTQLAQSLANFREYGVANGPLRYYLPNTVVPTMVGNGLGQFAPKRNDEEANSWEIGSWLGVDYYYSNLLPIHTAGTVGNTATTLTVTAIDPTGTILTLSGAAPSDANALKAGDLLTVGAGNTPKLTYRSFIGHQTISSDVQVRVEADAASDGGGIITATIFPALISDPTSNGFNLSTPIVPATTTVTSVPTHRAGFICSGDATYLAMPKLPNEDPFPTANAVDMTTGASIRMYKGSQFAQNSRGIVNDLIWGATAVGEYLMRVCFPV